MKYGVFICERGLVTFEQMSVDVGKVINQVMLHDEISMRDIKWAFEIELGSKKREYTSKIRLEEK